MTRKRNREAGTLPGYASEAVAQRRPDRKIGLRGLLSVGEEADLLVSGLTRRKAKNMTHRQIKELADMVLEIDTTHLGS